jgi:hypothetical protein
MPVRPLPAGGAASGVKWRASGGALDALPAGSRQLMLVAGGGRSGGGCRAGAASRRAAPDSGPARDKPPVPRSEASAPRTSQADCAAEVRARRRANEDGRVVFRRTAHDASPQKHERMQLARHSHRARLRTIELRERAVACRERLSNHLAATATPGAFPISIRECRLTRRSLSAGSRHNRTGMRHSRRNGQ